MNGIISSNNNLPGKPKRKTDKTETYAGKHTARVTKIYRNSDGSEIKTTEKINKDGSISKKIEQRLP